jgi:hypothetical protein
MGFLLTVAMGFLFTMTLGFQLTISITDALRAAKLDLIRSPAFSHPYFWAGYVVTGDSAKVVLPRKPWSLFIAGIAIVLAVILWAILSPRTGSSSSAGKRGRSTTGKRRR